MLRINAKGITSCRKFELQSLKVRWENCETKDWKKAKAQPLLR